MKLTIEEVQNDSTLVDEFIKQNAYLVHNTIKRHFPNLYLSKDYEDIIQTANISLYKAIRGYQSDKGAKFETYAINNIIGYIRSYVRSNNLGVSLSVTNQMRMDYRKYNYLSSIGKTDEQIALELGMSILKLQELIRTMNAVVCFDDVVTNNNCESETTFQDILPDTFDLQGESIERITLEQKKALIKKYVSSTHYEILELADKGFSKLEIRNKLKINRGKYSKFINDITTAFEYLNEYFEKGEDIHSVINKLSTITGGKRKMEKCKINERECIDIIKNWAIENPNQSIRATEILSGYAYQFKTKAIKNKAVEELKKEGYSIFQEGSVLKLIDGAVQEVAATVEPTKVADSVNKGDLLSFTKEIVNAISDNYDKLKDSVKVMSNEYNFKVEDKVLDNNSIDSLLNTIKTMCQLANADGKRIQATVLIKEIN